MNKEHLREYIQKNGAIEFLRDLASIFGDLSQEWNETNDKVAIDFADAETLISSSADLLESSEKEFKGEEANPIKKVEVLDIKQAAAEYCALQKFFADQTFKDFKKYYSSNNEEFMMKLNRMKALQDAIAEASKK